ncbi:MAG: hypothetical protein ACKVP0_01190 [Pirellulaceae bacterium]
MSRNPINLDTTIADIYRTREKVCDQFGGDITAILADARKRQEAGNRPIWQPIQGTSEESPSTIGDCQSGAP